MMARAQDKAAIPMEVLGISTATTRASSASALHTLIHRP